jgi:hypothetical protein
MMPRGEQTVYAQGRLQLSRASEDVIARQPVVMWYAESGKCSHTKSLASRAHASCCRLVVVAVETLLSPQLYFHHQFPGCDVKNFVCTFFHVGEGGGPPQLVTARRRVVLHL